MYERLAQICGQTNDDRSIKVIVFQGAGDKAFASGADINQFRAFQGPESARKEGGAELIELMKAVLDDATAMLLGDRSG